MDLIINSVMLSRLYKVVWKIPWDEVCWVHARHTVSTLQDAFILIRMTMVLTITVITDMHIQNPLLAQLQQQFCFLILSESKKFFLKWEIHLTLPPKSPLRIKGVNRRRHHHHHHHTSQPNPSWKPCCLPVLLSLPSTSSFLSISIKRSLRYVIEMIVKVAINFILPKTMVKYLLAWLSPSVGLQFSQSLSLLGFWKATHLAFVLTY